MLCAALVSLTAEARGINFHLFLAGDAGTELVAETARVKRCPKEFLDEEADDEKEVAACHPAEDGHLIALHDGKGGVTLKLIGKKGLRWKRKLDATIAFQDELFIVVETATGHRAIWLSSKDGSTTRSLDLMEEKGAVPEALKGCGDKVMKWFRGPASTGAICLVLD